MAKNTTTLNKFLTGSVTAAMVATAIVPVAAANNDTAVATFSDVPVTDTHYDNVMKAVEYSFMKGYPNNTFGPYEEMPRSQVVKALAKYLIAESGMTEQEYVVANNIEAVTPFNDVSADHADNELFNHSLIVKEAGIFTGSNNNLMPTNKITRQQMAKVIVEAFGFKDLAGVESKVTDNDKADASLRSYINILSENELTTETSFNPRGTVKRAQMASFLVRSHEAVNVAPEVVSVSAINSTQAVVEFNAAMGEVDATNFTVDNGVTVTSAKIDSTNNKKVILTFNKALEDNETYKVTTNGVESAKGKVLEKAIVSEFKYEVGTVNFVSLDQTTFNSFSTSDLLDYVTLKDDKGRDITSEVLNNTTDYTVSVSSTDHNIVDANGNVVLNAKGSAYVEVKVVNNANNAVLATTGAVKVTVAPLAYTSLDGIHLSDASKTVTEYKTAKAAGQVDSTIQLNEVDEVLNVYVKDANGTVVKVDASTAVITNTTPTVAVISKNGSEFVVNGISAGTAKADITVGGFKTTVTFNVVATSKVTSGSLDSAALTLTTDSDSPSYTGSVNLKIVDQYGDAITADEDNVGIRYSKAGVATVTPGVATNNVVPLNVTTDANGSTTVYVDYKNASGSVIFTKSFTVTVKDFGAAAKYDLVVSSSSADYLDADVDTNDSGLDKLDNDVVFSLYQVDAAGNRVATVALDGTNNKLVLDLVALTAAEEALLDQTSGALATNTLSFANDTLAQQTLKTAGTVKVSAQVGGVTVDNVNVTYKNTDSVATSAAVTKTSTVVDNEVVDNVSDILFGVYGSSSYTVSPILSVKDQNGKALTYNVASASGGTVDGLYNGLTVEPTWTATNLSSNVTVNPTTGEVTLVSGTSGTFTLVLAKVETSVNADLLSAPVAINVTIVD